MYVSHTKLGVPLREFFKLHLGFIISEHYNEINYILWRNILSYNDDKLNKRKKRKK